MSSVSEPLAGVIRSDFDSNFFKISAVRQVSSVEKYHDPPFQILYCLCEDVDTEGQPVMKQKESFFGKGFYLSKDPMFIFSHDLSISTDKYQYMLRCSVDIGTSWKFPFAVYSQKKDSVNLSVDTVIGFLGGHNNFILSDKNRISIEQVIVFRFTGATVPREQSFLQVPSKFTGNILLFSFNLQTWLTKLMQIAKSMDLYKTVSIIETSEAGSRFVEAAPSSVLTGFAIALVKREISPEKFIREIETLIECQAPSNLSGILATELESCGKEVVFFKNGKLIEA